MIDFCEPEVTESINRLTFDWPTMELRIMADRITDAGTAELWFYHCNSTGNKLLHTAKANLLSTTTMSTISKRMSKHTEDIPWTQVLTYISAHGMEYQRRGEPGIIIEPATEPQHPGYYIEPVVMKGVPTIIFGDKASKKTTIGLAVLGIMATGCENSPLGLVASTSCHVAMLDWESNQALTRYTVSRLVTGKSLPTFNLPYLRCKQSLSDDIDRIANFLHEHQVTVVLIDSLGQAAGSDRFDSSGKASALRFFEALRQLNVTSLIIAQNAKNEENRKTIFGSTFFTYYARNIFELRSRQDERDEDMMHAGLFHSESNYSKKYPPIGFNFQYTEKMIAITSEPTSLADYYEKASQTKELLELLKSGAKSRQTIIKALGISPNRAGVLLNRAKKRGDVTDLGSGIWTLRTNEKPSEG